MEYTGKLQYTFRNDYMFKAVLQKNKRVLTGLLSSLLGTPMDEIVDVHLENPIILGESIDNKTVMLDILVTLNHDQRVNVEMQVIKQEIWVERSLTYLCKTFNQLNVGEAYDQVMKTVHIGIVDFELFENEDIFYSKNLLMDTKTQRIYSDKLGVNVLNLRHMENATQEDKANGLYAWARLFASSTWEELKMVVENSEIMQEAVVTFKELTEDEKIRMQCEARERYELDWKTMEHRTERYKKQSEEYKKQSEEYRQQLTAQTNLLLAYQLLRQNAPISEIAEKTGLSEDEIKAL
jgi:predicted transposase/invertase (TIGR01784 family)